MNNQWENPTILTLIVNSIKSCRYLFFTRKKNIEAIESFFMHFYEKQIVLMPSGRSAIHHFALINNLSRHHTSFVTKYSSFCLYQSLGSLTNVSTDFSEPDLIVVNHKWGYKNIEHRASQKLLVLEDSCDSLIINKSALFPNNGDAEIISLSKILGTLSGAIIVLNDAISPKTEYMKLQYVNTILGYKQFIRKLWRILIPNYSKLALQSEYANTYLTSLELALIRHATEFFEVNFYLNNQRYLALRDIFYFRESKLFRIGQGVVLKASSRLSYLLNLEMPAGIIRRQFDFSRSNDFENSYEECLYVPIHSGVSPYTFELYLEFVAKHKDLLTFVEFSEN